MIKYWINALKIRKYKVLIKKLLIILNVKNVNFNYAIFAIETLKIYLYIKYFLLIKKKYFLLKL